LADHTDHLFAYGTLKRGLRNHHVIAHFAAEIIPAAVMGRLLDFQGRYPFLLLMPPGADPSAWHRVEGELVTLRDPAGALARLDELEGLATGLYERVRVGLLEPDDAEAWTYIAPGNSAPRGTVPLGRTAW